MARNTLPFAVGHLRKALLVIEGLSPRIGALSRKVARRDGRIAKCCYFHTCGPQNFRLNSRQKLSPTNIREGVRQGRLLS